MQRARLGKQDKDLCGQKLVELENRSLELLLEHQCKCKSHSVIGYSGYKGRHERCALLRGQQAKVLTGPLPWESIPAPCECASACVTNHLASLQCRESIGLCAWEMTTNRENSSQVFD